MYSSGHFHPQKVMQLETWGKSNQNGPRAGRPSLRPKKVGRVLVSKAKDRINQRSINIYSSLPVVNGFWTLGSQKNASLSSLEDGEEGLSLQRYSESSTRAPLTGVGNQRKQRKHTLVPLIILKTFDHLKVKVRHKKVPLYRMHN